MIKGAGAERGWVSLDLLVSLSLCARARRAKKQQNTPSALMPDRCFLQVCWCVLVCVDYV